MEDDGDGGKEASYFLSSPVKDQKQSGPEQICPVQDPWFMHAHVHT